MQESRQMPPNKGDFFFSLKRKKKEKEEKPTQK